MATEEKSFIKNVLCFFTKLLLLVGIVVAFYKLPGVIAEKINYWKLKNKKINQEYDEEE